MSERALAFLEEWVNEHIHVEGYEPDGDNARAKQLADQCLIDAQADGIPNAEFDEAVDDLTAFMAGQIVEVTDREVNRLVDKDRVDKQRPSSRAPPRRNAQ